LSAPSSSLSLGRLPGSSLQQPTPAEGSSTPAEGSSTYPVRRAAAGLTCAARRRRRRCPPLQHMSPPPTASPAAHVAAAGMLSTARCRRRLPLHLAPPPAYPAPRAAADLWLSLRHAPPHPASSAPHGAAVGRPCTADPGRPCSARHRRLLYAPVADELPLLWGGAPPE
jgi:hypothetical protein